LVFIIRIYHDARSSECQNHRGIQKLYCVVTTVPLHLKQDAFTGATPNAIDLAQCVAEECAVEELYAEH